MKRILSILLIAIMTTSVSAQWPGRGQQQGQGQQSGQRQFGQRPFGQGQRPFGQGQMFGQGQQKFSPEKFEADLQAYITKEANLTPQEAAKFFPVYKEMQEKQRALFERQRQLASVKPADEQGCLKVIKESDEIDLELKRIQQSYHSRFLELMPASKVYDILKAELGFHRHMMRSWGRGSRQEGQQQPQR